MRHQKQSRAISYDLDSCRWIVLLCALALAMWAVWPAAAQQAAEPADADLAEKIATADVDEDQVEKIVVDDETTIEVLDVEGEAEAARRPETTAPQQTDVTTVAPAEGAAPMAWDRRLVQSLERRLQDDPFINADQVQVTAVDGTVTLSGTVPALTAKRRAGDLARAMRGVQAVENKLVVRETDVPDATIRSYVQAALTQQPEVTVTVNEGRVTLGGAVTSWQEKELAGDLAARAHGVASVTNDIEVTGAADLGTETIAEEVNKRLRADPWIDANAINVSVEGGSVKLSGTVKTLAQQERAFANAWVRGVREVDISALTVAPFEEARVPAPPQDQAPAEQSPSAAAAQQEFERIALDDQEIREAALLAFQYSPRLKNFKPEIEVDNGVVMLSGVADTVRTKTLAEEAVKNLRGVWRVENTIEIQSDTGLTDDELADRVREKLDEHPGLSQLEVAVTVLEGAAYLSGTVGSVSHQREAREVAAAVPGIKKVYNSVNLAEERATRDDFQLKQEIENVLYWSPYVDLDDIDVTVTQGVVTLTGAVERWASRLAAEDAAMQVGAVQVNNQLRVLEGPMEMARPEEQPLVRIDVNEEPERF